MNLCLGTVQLGMNYGISNIAGRPTYAQAESIVASAYEKGVRYFDTAHSYGDSESILGKIFSNLRIADDVKVITKLPIDFDINKTEEYVMNSLELLGLKQLEGLLLHRPIDRNKHQKLSQVVKELKRKKLILNFGASIYSLEEALEYVNYDFIDYMQIPCNVLSFEYFKSDFFSLAKSRNITVFMRSILLQGLLTMSQEEMKVAGMHWARADLNELHRFTRSERISIKSFALQLTSNMEENIMPTIGINSQRELVETISLMTSKSISIKTYKEWWSKDLKISSRTLNPSLW